MAEPVSTTGAVAAGASVGIITLLAGWLGQAGADVTMVLMAALAGGYLALNSESSHETWARALGHLIIGVAIAFTFAWALAGLAISFYPAAQGPYLPAIISFVLGVVSRRIPRIIHGLIDKGEQQLGVAEKANQ